MVTVELNNEEVTQMAALIGSSSVKIVDAEKALVLWYKFKEAANGTTE